MVYANVKIGILNSLMLGSIKLRSDLGLEINNPNVNAGH
jgi:hypothetical protein